MAIKIVKKVQTDLAMSLTVGNVYLGNPQSIEIYCRVDLAQVSKTSGHARVSFTNNENSEHLGGLQVDFNYDLEGENPIKQAYQHLKTLPEFEGAEDC